MKKFLLLFVSLASISQSSFAATNISTLFLLTQDEFRILSEDMGSALSYKPVTPAEPLGVTGFDVGLVVTSADVKRSSQSWSKATNNGEAINNLYIPKLHISKGLPLTSVLVTTSPTSNPVTPSGSAGVTGL